MGDCCLFLLLTIHLFSEFAHKTCENIGAVLEPIGVRKLCFRFVGIRWINLPGVNVSGLTIVYWLLKIDPRMWEESGSWLKIVYWLLTIEKNYCSPVCGKRAVAVRRSRPLLFALSPRLMQELVFFFLIFNFSVIVGIVTHPLRNSHHWDSVNAFTNQFN